MKILLIIIIVLLCPFYTYAQKIVMDKVEENGDRHVLTEDVTVVYAKTTLGVVRQSGVGMSLYCVAHGSDTNYYLNFRVVEKAQIDTGRKLLLKLSDGNIITLENSKKIGPLDYDSYVGEYQVIYWVIPTYLISREDIVRIIEQGVVKIRIETDTDSIDRDVKASRIKDVLKKCLRNIDETMQKKKDIYSDF